MKSVNHIRLGIILDRKHKRLAANPNEVRVQDKPRKVKDLIPIDLETHEFLVDAERMRSNILL